MMMEETKGYASSIEHPSSTHTYPRTSIPDVPEDVDFLMEHLNDPNFDLTKRPTSARSASAYNLEHKKFKRTSSDIDAESQISGRYAASRAESRNSTHIDFDDESPYPEVRAAVSSVDDPLIPVNTFRMWFLGIIFSVLVAGLNQVFNMRFPSVFITGIVIQLISLPVGKGLAQVLPTTQFKTFGYVWSFNPGPFNIKEHVCITVMANVCVSGAYATEVIATQRIFYNQKLSFTYEALIALGTQTLGFCLGGLLRQFVVWPSSMIWPGALVNSALFNTLHKTYGQRENGHMTREKFFLIACGCSFLWYWIPGYLFTALSVFNWACWIAPNNVVVNSLFGTVSGLGMGVFTFDWSMISYIGSPLVTPWWSELNTFVSLVIFFWILCPIIYFTNTFNTGYLPILSTRSFDNTGIRYIPAAIVTDGIFDLEKYRAYSPVYMSAALCVYYGVSFAAFPAVIVHTFLWFRRDIVRRFKSTLRDERDIHSRLMQAYAEVPWFWYLAVGGISFAFICIAIEIFPTQLPIWAAFLAFILAILLALPLSMLQAITNQHLPTQVIAELIIGYILPGRPIANIIFKTTAYIGTNQAVAFAGDLKLGHYMKVPPRMMFMVQIVGVIIACLVSVAVQDWMLANITDICTKKQTNGFTCPNTNTFATASLLWGGVGPARLFSPGQPYNALSYFFLIGAILPIPFYFLARRFPLSFWRYINLPVMFAGVGAMPPGTGINYSSWALVGFIFNYLVRRYHFRWWMRFNYILSAALDAGVALGMVVIFFAVIYPTKNYEIEWWGNTVWQNTADANLTPRLILNEGETFGPTTWS